MTEELDLGTVFQSVTANLVNNREEINKADSYNQDHGDNMVEIFQLITKAVGEKKDSTQENQLSYASEMLSQQLQSGSSQKYSRGLGQAAQLLQGQKVGADNIAPLIQALLGGGQPPAQAPEPQGSDDLIGSLLSSFTGGGQPPAQEPKPQASTDMIGSLLSSFTGGDQSSQSQDGLDLGDLLNAGMTFFQSKQEGDSNLEALVDVLVSGSLMGQRPDHAQSSSVVANTMLQMFGSMMAK